MSRCLQATCLKPHYSLRYQLFVSFGVTSAIAIGVVMLVATLTAKSSGEAVKTLSRDLLREQVVANTRASSEHAADALSKKFESLEGVASLMAEATRDRIVGYPLATSDENIPFKDVFSSQTIYPLASHPLPPDWNITVNVNDTNYQEHVQDRWSWYASVPISTQHAVYRIQGQCDPSETDPTSRTYYSNCTDDNNKLETGGVVQRTEHSEFLSKTAADLGIFLKPLYEAHQDVKLLGIYFANSGAGSSIVYPGYVIDGTSHYTSIGCDWMHSINPYTNESYATPQEIARCHPANTQVPGREYNPLERQWCRDQALEPKKAQIVGPYVDAFNRDLWLLTIGKAVFDRTTGHFLGCTLLDVSIERIADILKEVQSSDSSTDDIAMVRWDDGTVVYSNQWDTSNANETINITALDFCDSDTYHRLKSLVNFSEPWDPHEVAHIFHDNLFAPVNNDVASVAAFPIPEPPTTYDPSYKPEFMVIQSVGEEIYKLIGETEATIDDDVQKIYCATLTIGFMGIIVVLIVTFIVATWLTRPLNWMMDVCKQIVHSLASDNNKDNSIYGSNKKPLMKCAPKTEITDLVSEFQSVVQNFSGEGPATVASPGVNEVFNQVSWSEEFGREYLEQLFEHGGGEAKAGGELVERRLSFASSVASHASLQSLELDETSGSGDGLDGETKPAATAEGVVSETPSQMKRREEQPALASYAGHVQNLTVRTSETTDGGGDVENEAGEATAEVKAPTAPQPEDKDPQEQPGPATICSGSTRVNKGPIAPNVMEDSGAGRFDSELRMSVSRNQLVHSPLFWWIVVLIVTPVLVTMASICAIVTKQATAVLPSWLEVAEEASITLETEFIIASASSHATFAEEIFVQPVSDLHLLTRVSSWLLFGGLKLANSFTEMEQATEECKTFPDNNTCPFFFDEDRTPCDCRWGDPHANGTIHPVTNTPRWCSDYGDNDRSLQRQHYAVQKARDNNIKYPDVDYSPETTLWWDDTASMPGAPNSSANLTDSPGYSTVYDRTRVTSATAIVNIPLYNYRTGLRQKHLGMFIGYEADGMLAGYAGCDYSFAQYSHFVSTEANGAFKISPELCPLGKYGYDSRCRGWYDEGKQAGTVHLTAPYVFAGTGDIANSVTFPLVDPSTGEHVGQTLIDFFPDGMDKVAHKTSQHSRLHHSFTMVVTPKSDALGGDTLVGPGYEMGTTSPPIQLLTMPCDEASSENRQDFDTRLLSDMKQGKSGESKFRRRAFVTDGEEVTCLDTEEDMFISYAPLLIRAANPLRSDDFSRGVNVSEILMGSLGVAVPVDDLAASFEVIEGQATEEINSSTALLIGLIAATAAVATAVLVMITVSVVKPVTILLEFVRLINKKHTLHDIPPMRGGSREVNQVYASLAKLHKIVHFSNMAFFSGKLKSAYKFLTDALSLFRRADDRKAIGIASNNLGNTLLGIRDHKLSTSRCFSADGECVHNQARQSYTESIESATSEYEESSVTDNADLHAKLAEQLANRYFNRGLFFLHTMKDACASSDFAEQGRHDLLKARELDAEVRGIWVETRQIHKNSVRYFERLLRRANGLVGLMEKDITEAGSWNVADLLDEADSLLFVVWNMPGSPLFDAMSPTGRLQQLEGTAIRYELSRDNAKEAARISNRMLVEDESIVESAFSAASSAMLSWFRTSPPPPQLRTSELGIERDFRRMLQNCKTAWGVPIGKNFAYFQDVACHDEFDSVLDSFANKLSDSCHDDDFVILPSVDASGKDMVLSLREKGEMEQSDWSPGWKRRRIGDINTEFRRAIRLVLESKQASENDTWIVLVTDRTRWDPVQCRLSESHHYLLSEISQLNKARSTAGIHVAIVSMDADGNMAEICNELGRVSRESIYVNVRGETENLDDALAEVASFVIGGGKKARSIPGGITMEQF